MKSTKTIAGALSVLAAGLALTACGGGGESNGNAAVPAASKSSQSSGLPQGSEPVNLNPADFTTKIDNPYWPMKPGSRNGKVVDHKRARPRTRLPSSPSARSRSRCRLATSRRMS